MTDTFWDRQMDEPEAEVGQEGWVDDPTEVVPVDDAPSRPLLGLLNLGELQARINVHDHDVVLRTLKMDEELEIGLLVQRFQGTLEEGRALATALVAASIESIDGKPLTATLGPQENSLQRKFDYVRTRMYWPIIRILYEEGYIPLIEQQVAALEEFRKK